MKVLFVYFSFPDPDMYAGSFRLYGIVAATVGAGHKVVLLAQRTNTPKARAALEAMGVVCVSDADLSLRATAAGFGEFLRTHAFDVAVLVQHQNYAIYAPYLRALLPKCHCVLDTVDLHFIRAAREAEVKSERRARKRADAIRRSEFRAIRSADSVWAVADAECDIIRREVLGQQGALHTIPIIHKPLSEPPGFASREGVVFLGGYGHSPNVDAVEYFMAEIHPRLEQILPNVPVTIAGSNCPDSLRRFERRSGNVRVVGFVEDHRSLLASHRVGIAPLRYGAGIKGKIGEYFSCGLPCVTTAIGAEGMDLEPGTNVLIGDCAQSFADGVARVYREPALWETLSHGGVDYVRRRCSPEAITPALLRALDDARESPPRGGRTFRAMVSLLTPSQSLSFADTAVRALLRGGWRELRASARVWLNR